MSTIKTWLTLAFMTRQWDGERWLEEPSELLETFEVEHATSIVADLGISLHPSDRESHPSFALTQPLPLA